MKKKLTKRGTPARRKKTPAKKRTTALARRGTVEVLEPQIVPDLSRSIGDGIQLGELGLVEMRLTPEEEAVLSEPPPLDKLRIMPSADGAVYAPHPEYTRFFNRAFGRMGWSIVPVGKPALANKTVVTPYILYIHGKPAAFAQGEQEFFDNNKGQSYGDALESTVASGLRRCAKRIGVWLELWDRQWAETFRDTYGIKVWVKGKDDGDKNRPQWRLRTDPPFWNEEGKREDRGRREEPRREREQPRESAPAGFNPDDGETITLQQRDRLVKLVQRIGRSQAEVTGWLASRFGAKSSKDIKRRDYEYICTAIEHPGELPPGPRR